MSNAMQQISLLCARRPFLRRLAHVAFRLPAVGRTLHGISESVVPPEDRIWVQIDMGAAQGLWLKVLPKWEPGYLLGCAEQGMNEALSRHLKPGGCFYDVGAHIGFYSLIAARLVGRDGHVLAFEPDPDNAHVIEQSAAKNDFPQISVIRCAVSSQPGRVRFRRSAHDGASRMSGMVISGTRDAEPGSEVISCEAVSLDAVSASGAAPDLIKIDVEGAEMKVLEGARSLLTRHKPVLIVEVHDERNYPVAQAMLSALGYALQPVWLRPGMTWARNFVAEAASES